MGKEDASIDSGFNSQSLNWLNLFDEDQIYRLNRSLDQAEKGEFILHDEVKAKYAFWLN